MVELPVKEEEGKRGKGKEEGTQTSLRYGFNPPSLITNCVSLDDIIPSLYTNRSDKNLCNLSDNKGLYRADFPAGFYTETFLEVREPKAI